MEFDTAASKAGNFTSGRTASAGHVEASVVEPDYSHVTAGDGSAVLAGDPVSSGSGFVKSPEMLVLDGVTATTLPAIGNGKGLDGGGDVGGLPESSSVYSPPPSPSPLRAVPASSSSASSTACRLSVSMEDSSTSCSSAVTASCGMDVPQVSRVSDLALSAEELRLPELPGAAAASMVGSCRVLHVSFPSPGEPLVTGYIEPADPLRAMYAASRADLAVHYRRACRQHDCAPLETVLAQVAALPVSVGGSPERVDALTLRGVPLCRRQCESLEAVLMRVQFGAIDVSGCCLDDDSAAALFEMIEFYDSALSVSFGGNRLGVRGWQACARLLRSCAGLQRLSAAGVELCDHSSAVLSRSLRLARHLRVLRLEGCQLHGRPMAMLISGLKQNPALKELYLGENQLGTGDGLMLGTMLLNNPRLDLIDLRINNFDNDSLCFLLEALSKQPCTAPGDGLLSLNLWCNRFTISAIGSVATLLSRHRALDTLNLGRNVLGDESLLLLKDALMQNASLCRLGLQECQLSCEGIVALAEILADNSALLRLDLRGNRVGAAGLMALERALEHNRTLEQVDLPHPGSADGGDVSGRVSALRAAVDSRCQANRQRRPSADEDDGVVETRPAGGETMLRRLSAALRRVSLTCDAPAAAVVAATVPAIPTVAAPAVSAATVGIVECNGELVAAPDLQQQPAASRRRLVSPSPSPSSSPLPSSCRNRFRVFRVVDGDLNGSPPVPPGTLASAAHCLQCPGHTRRRTASESDATLSPSPSPRSLGCLSPSQSPLSLGAHCGISPSQSPVRGFTVTPVCSSSSPSRVLVRTVTSPSPLRMVTGGDSTAVQSRSPVRGFLVTPVLEPR